MFNMYYDMMFGYGGGGYDDGPDAALRRREQRAMQATVGKPVGGLHAAPNIPAVTQELVPPDVQPLERGGPSGRRCFQHYVTSKGCTAKATTRSDSGGAKAMQR